jgi:hypothetical protein
MTEHSEPVRSDRSEQIEDHSGEEPSPALYKEVLERVRVAGSVGPLDGEIEFHTKGSLHRSAEHLVITITAVITMAAMAWLCDLVGSPAWVTIASSLLVGIATIVVGRRHVATQPAASSAPSIPPTSSKEGN